MSKGASASQTGLSSASPMEPATQSPPKASIPCAGEWAVVHSSYGAPHVRIIDKVSPKIIKFAGPFWPRQARLSEIVAAMPDKESAERLSQSIGGAAGHRNERLRKARDDFAQREQAIWAAYYETVNRLAASAIEARQGQDAQRLDAKHESAVRDSGDAQ